MRNCGRSHGRKKTILLVEDDADHRYLIEKNLLDLDRSICVESAMTAEEAIDHILRKPADIVLTDYNLPGMNGLDMMMRMRQLKVDTPCIILTGQANEVIAEKARKSGARGFFFKEEGRSCYEKIVASIGRIITDAAVELPGHTGRSQKKAPCEEIGSAAPHSKKRGRSQRAGAAKDDAGRIEADRALRELEIRYSAIVEHANDAITIIVNGTIVFANRAAAELTGYEGGTLIGKSYKDVVALEYQELVKERNTDRLMGLEPPSIYAIQLQRNDGSLRDVEISASTIPYQGEKATLVVLRDLTDRKRIEAELIKNRQIMWKLMNTIDDPLMLLDINGVVLLCNDALGRRFRMTPAELVGKCVFDLLPDDVSRKRYACRAELLAQKKLIRYEDENRGTWFDNYLLPVLDSDGNIEYVVVYARNITEYKRAQQKSKEHQQELENFIWGISHDLKTPLVNIREFSSLLLKDGTDERDFPRFIDRIHVNSLKAINLIKGIQDYARYTSRQKVYELFNPGELLREITADLQDRPEFNQSIIAIAEKWPDIRADRTLIYQVFLNLLENALKYGGKRITAGWLIEDGQYRISISDDGMGIEDSMKDKIFDLFTRSPRVSQEIEGAGIGLSVVKKAVEEHGGLVQFKSQVNNGSTFQVNLPISSE